MTRLYAQPYDITAHGFYFEAADEYNDKARKLRNSYGLPVEEFELQFIDGENIDAKLFEALAINQVNVAAFLQGAEDWSDDDKIKIIIAVGETGYTFDLGKDSPDRFDVDLYEMDSLHDLAVQFVDEGLYGTIPAPIQNYLDTPWPAICAWITAKSPLTAPAIFTAAINPLSRPRQSRRDRVFFHHHHKKENDHERHTVGCASFIIG